MKGFITIVCSPPDTTSRDYFTSEESLGTSYTFSKLKLYWRETKRQSNIEKTSIYSKCNRNLSKTEGF